MKSKPALYRIMTALQNNDEYDYFHLQEEFQTIIKDLKVLEILRKHLRTHFTTWAEVITCDIDSSRDEDYTIIEEWLHNDK